MWADMITCPACGKFRFDSRVNLWMSGVNQIQKDCFYKISFALRSISERAIGKRDSSFFPIYTVEDFERIVESTDPPIVDKLQMLLQYLAKTTDYPGQINEFDASNDYPIVCARNYQESNFYLNALIEQGLCSYDASFTGKSAIRFKITAAGWTELDRVAKSGYSSSEAFIAMWFDKSRQPMERATGQALEDAGYKPVRIDKIEHVNRIDDEIIARIRRSKFLVADFTGQRNGVYFEAGFMLGLGRPVIWICEKADLKNVHFDTRQYNTIDYVDSADLQKRLQVRIEAIMGKGPIANNGMPHQASDPLPK
jgi:nucleoside 2-deoxyribosyltransferase